MKFALRRPVLLLKDLVVNQFRVGRFTKQSTTETDRAPDTFEGIGRQFLWYQPDQLAGIAVIPGDVITINDDLAFARIDNTANNADQRGLAGTIWPQQRKYLAVTDIQIDIRQCPLPGSIDLGKISDRNYRLHDKPFKRRK